MSIARRFVWAFLLVGLGWTVGFAERPEPEFMIAIDALLGRLGSNVCLVAGSWERGTCPTATRPR